MDDDRRASGGSASTSSSSAPGRPPPRRGRPPAQAPSLSRWHAPQMQQQLQPLAPRPEKPDIQQINALRGQPGVSFPGDSSLEDGLADYFAPVALAPAAARPADRSATRMHGNREGHSAAAQEVLRTADQHSLYVAQIMGQIMECEPEMLSVRSEEAGQAEPAARSEGLAEAQMVGSSMAAAAGGGVAPNQAGRWDGAGGAGAGPAPFPGRATLAGVSGGGLSGGGRGKGLRSVSASAEQVLCASPCNLRPCTTGAMLPSCKPEPDTADCHIKLCQGPVLTLKAALYGVLWASPIPARCLFITHDCAAQAAAAAFDVVQAEEEAPEGLERDLYWLHAKQQQQQQDGGQGGMLLEQEEPVQAAEEEGPPPPDSIYPPREVFVADTPARAAHAAARLRAIHAADPATVFACDTEARPRCPALAAHDNHHSAGMRLHDYAVKGSPATLWCAATSGAAAACHVPRSSAMVNELHLFSHRG